MASPDRSNPDHLEVRLRAIEDLIKDIKRWAAVIGFVLLGFSGFGLYQIPGYVKKAAIDAAQAAATAEATRVAKETADTMVKKVTEGEIVEQMEKFRLAASESAETARKSATTAVGQVKASNDLLEQLEKQKLQIANSLLTLSHAKPNLLMKKHQMTWGISERVEFDFPVKHAWYYFSAGINADRKPDIELVIDGNYVVLTGIKVGEAGPNKDPRVTIMLFGSDF